MSLGRFMHPRNLYKNNRPDFKKLALDHEGFRQVAKTTMTGSVSLDFKDPSCHRALAQALLKSDFGLDVEFPVDRLIPAVPQRLNYIHWLEDIFSENKQNLTGVDVGCGSSCVFALLGHTLNNWRFICTEIDKTNLTYSRENVKRNNLTEKVTVLEGDGTMLQLAVDHIIAQQPTDKATDNSAISEGSRSPALVDFCMCNPPFFDNDESKSCRKSRPEAKHSTSAAESEMYVSGGEVKFVKNMITESLTLRNKIRVYTSMVGKKRSLPPIKKYLRDNGVTHYSTTEFCQGRTMRWGIAWTFDHSISFPKSLFREERKGQTVYSHIISADIDCCVYDVPAITQHVKDMLTNQLQMKLTTLHQDVGEFVCVVTARKNTWANQRKLKRLAKQKQQRNEQDNEPQEQESTPPTKKPRLAEDNTAESTIQRSDNSSIANQSSVSLSGKQDSSFNKLTNQEIDSGESSCDDSPPLITFSLEVLLEGLNIKLLMKLIGKGDKDMLHQILVYFKNQLK